MLPIVYAPAAVLDLQGIAKYTLDTFGDTMRDEYLGALRAKIERLAALPGIGVPIPRHAGLRRVLVERHAIYYRADSERVAIVRVLAQRQDPSLVDL